MYSAPWERSVPAVFSEIAQQRRHQLAVKVGAVQVSYGELDHAASRVANALLTHLGIGQEPVAVLMDHGVEAITAPLGILKAGKFFAVLDPRLPPAHIVNVLSLLGARCILTTTSRETWASALALEAQLGDDVVVLAVDDPVWRRWPQDDPRLEIAPGALAQVIYTSGSTGEPKGVLWNHRNILHRLFTYETAYGIGPTDRVLSAGSLSYGATWSRAFSALLTGAGFYHFDLRGHSFAQLTETLRSEQITVFFAAVSTLRQFLTSVDLSVEFPSVRLVQTGGDSVLRTDVELVRQRFPLSCSLRVGLSLSEAGAVSHWLINHDTPLDGPTVPVGYVAPDKEVLILDDSGAPLPAGRVGEIAVRSHFLSSGYWRRPDLDAQRFTVEPESDSGVPAGPPLRLCLTGDLGKWRADGQLEHVGRKDFMVKIRGFRVELGAVEAALMATGLVRDAAVVAQQVIPATSGGAPLRRLVAYVSPWPDVRLSMNQLRQRLADTLPDYMVPSRFELLSALPLSANGKTDRRALPPPNRSRPDLDYPYQAPDSETERRLAAIWSEVLDVEPVGVHDHFLDLGGSSIIAAQIVARIARAMETDLPLGSVLDAPTVAQQAAMVERHWQQSLGNPQADLVDALAGVSEPERTRLLESLAQESR